jgi:hypothetical protein
MAECVAKLLDGAGVVATGMIWSWLFCSRHVGSVSNVMPTPHKLRAMNVARQTSL